MRPGELFALRWEDIDFAKKEISVTHTLFYHKLEGDEKKTYHINPPKTKISIPKIPINRQCEIAFRSRNYSEM